MSESFSPQSSSARIVACAIRSTGLVCGRDLPEIGFRGADDGDAASFQAAHCATSAGVNTG